MKFMDAQPYWKEWAARCRRDLIADIMPFWMKHGWDRKNGGEWYGYLHRDGTVAQPAKGNLFKGPFHIPRMMAKSIELAERIK